jgi:hypothetical protein
MDNTNIGPLSFLKPYKVIIRGGSGLIFWARGRLRLHTLGSGFLGLKNLPHKSLTVVGFKSGSVSAQALHEKIVLM